MTIQEKKVDAIAMYLLSDTPNVKKKALADLKNLMSGTIPAGSIQEEITSILKDLGVPERNTGFEYLVTAIRLVTEDKSLTRGVTKILYPEVAKICNTTASSVERGIRLSINRCIDRYNEDAIHKYFGNTVDPDTGSLTNSEFIAQIANAVRQRMGGA